MILLLLITGLILHIFASGVTSQEMVSVLVRSPNSPSSTSSGVDAPLQCTKNSDESYAVCASYSNTAIKYNLQPFSFAAKGPNHNYYMISCDLCETASQSTSFAICVKGYQGTNGTVYFHNVSDMINVTNVTIGITGAFPHVVVDTPNEIAYVSNFYNPPAIYKITNIRGSTPILSGNLTTFGSGDDTPAAMLIIDVFLFVHLVMGPARLARINILSFTWNQTVNFANGENGAYYDNLVNDNNFIYDLTESGILVRCTYKNNNFARFDSLNTGYGKTYSLAISPDSTFLLFTSDASGILVVNTSSFSVESRALLANPTSSGYVRAWGRPIILSKSNNTNTHPAWAFSATNDYLYIFNVSMVPFREAYPIIYPLPTSPIITSSGVSGSQQCTKNSDESYAVCASFPSNTAIKYNLQPFSVAAKGPNQGFYMLSCDLYETAAQATSRAVCVKGTHPPVSNGTVYFHRVFDMTVNATVAIGITRYVYVIVDTPNQIAYCGNGNNNPPSIYKITNIGNSNPTFAATLTSFGSGDEDPAAMLIVDGFLYAHFGTAPARLARINISSFEWNQTVTFSFGENGGVHDNLANDGNYIYDLLHGGILVRCAYKNNNFVRFDSLNVDFSESYSLAISPDQRTLFVAGLGNSVLQMIDTTSFSTFGNMGTVPSAFGRPIVTSWCNVYAFSYNSDSVYAFRLNSSACQTRSSELSTSITGSSSIGRTTTNSSSNSISSSKLWSSTASSSITPTVSVSTSLSSSISNLTTESLSLSETRSLPSTGSATQSLSSSFSASHSNSDNVTSTISDSNSPSQSDSPSETNSVSVSISVSSTNSVTSTFSISSSQSSSISISESVTSSKSESLTSTSSLSSTSSQSVSNSPSISHSNSFTASISISASPSSANSWSTSITTSLSSSLTTSYSSTHIDCRRIVNQSNCDRPGIPCAWCQNIGACIDDSESCSLIHCNSFSVVAKTIDNNLCPSSQCHYCPKTKTCLNKTEDPTCSCVVASLSSSSCNASGECFWCNTNISFFEQPPNSVNLCINNNNNISPEAQECNCAFLPQHICNQTSSPCEWCDAVNSCIDARIRKCEDTRCTHFTPLILSGQCPSQKCGVCRGICVRNNFAGQNCNPSKFDETTCDGCHNCSWNLPIVLGVGDSNPYCVMSASPLNCESPPTCNGINSNENENRNQCEASGCKFDTDRNLCANQDCFFFVLNGFVLQPFALTVFGFVKDFIVLLLIGVFGDSFMRFIRRRIFVPFKFWRNNWDRKKIVANLDRTIYVNDSKCRDGTSGRNESFEKYCERIMIELFEFPTENNDEGISHVSFDGSPSTQDEKHESKNWKIKSKVLDAVAFSMYDSGLWIDLDDDGYCGITNGAVKLNAYLEALLSQDESLAQFLGDRMTDPGSHGVDDEEANKNENGKFPLTEKIINSRVNLQKIVIAAITARATAVVFYASSRDPKTRAAAALNSFPSPMQLLFYLCGVLGLVISAFYTVLGNKENVAIVNRISSYTCSSNSSSLTPNSTSTSGIVSADGRATFFLLGFRLMNASTLATVMLLFVKTVRAIWSHFGERFFVMNLPQRLPIMSLYTKRSSQFLLSFYFLLVFPCAFAGVTYGLNVTGSLIVCCVAIILLVLDVSILSLIRSVAAKKEKEELAAARRKLLEEEVELQNVLGLIPEKEISFFHASDDNSDFDEATSQEGGNNNDDDDNDNDDNNDGEIDEALDDLIGSPRNKKPPAMKRKTRTFREKRRKRRSEMMLEKLYGRVDTLLVDEIEDDGGWDEITAEETLTAKRNSLTDAAPTTLAKAFLVFILSEELPTIILTFAFQMCFNYMCLMEYKSSFGVNDQSEAPQLEYNSRKLGCVVNLFVNDLSGIINGVSSFFAYL